MWSPPDPFEPTSELYRVMPPRRPRSDLREALDAATGRDRQAPAEPPVLPDPPPAATEGAGWQRFAAFCGDVVRHALGIILATAVLAVIAIVWALVHR